MSPSADDEPAYTDYALTMAGADDADLEWVGVAAGDHDRRPRVYDPESGTEYKAEFDHDAEQVVATPEASRDLPTAALGRVITGIGEWEWLSAFALDHVADEDSLSIGE